MTGLARCRKNAAISQVELANALHVSQSTISAWESGENYPTADKLPKIAEACGCTIDDLYKTDAPAEARAG